ncbi:MAG: hypothetical protein OK438_07880 [Thaumarchaeota archaeon]|nr:hypothetical protein [Nitrososphaerota archaeon]
MSSGRGEKMKKRNLAIVLVIIYVAVVVVAGNSVTFTCFPETTNCQSYSPVDTLLLFSIPAASMVALYLVVPRTFPKAFANHSTAQGS